MKNNYIAIALLVAVVGVLGIRASLMSPADLNRNHINYYYEKIESGKAGPQDVDMYKDALEDGINFAQAELEDQKRWVMKSKMSRVAYNRSQARIAALEQEIQDLEDKLSKLEIE